PRKPSRPPTQGPCLSPAPRFAKCCRRRHSPQRSQSFPPPTRRGHEFPLSLAAGLLPPGDRRSRTSPELGATVAGRVLRNTFAAFADTSHLRVARERRPPRYA